MIKLTISIDETELPANHPLIEMLVGVLRVAKTEKAIKANYETEAWLEAIKLNPEVDTTRTDVRYAVERYCEEHGIPKPTLRGIYDALRAMGCREKKIHGVRYICGVDTLASEPELF